MTVAMAHAYAEVAFHGPNGRMEKKTLMVDTGALFTWIPASLAESLGVQHEELRPFRIATGEVVHRWVGYLLVEVLGSKAPTIVVLGDEGIQGLLGVHALEGLLLEVDPTNHVLRRVTRRPRTPPLSGGPPPFRSDGLAFSWPGRSGDSAYRHSVGPD